MPSAVCRSPLSVYRILPVALSFAFACGIPVPAALRLSLSVPLFLGCQSAALLFAFPPVVRSRPLSGGGSLRVALYLPHRRPPPYEKKPFGHNGRKAFVCRKMMLSGGAVILVRAAFENRDDGVEREADGAGIPSVRAPERSIWFRTAPLRRGTRRGKGTPAP